MFESSIKFNQNISSWDVSSVTDMGGMFKSAIVFNQDLSSWKVSSLEKMETMFNYALKFRQNLCSWGNKLPPELVQQQQGSSAFGSPWNEDVFSGSGCPDKGDPSLLANPPG